MDENPWKNQENYDLIFFSERIIGIYFSIHKSSNKGIPYPELGTTGSLSITHLRLFRFVFVSENTHHINIEKSLKQNLNWFFFSERESYIAFLGLCGMCYVDEAMQNSQMYFDCFCPWRAGIKDMCHLTLQHLYLL